MKRSVSLLIILIFLAQAPGQLADEGMWTFDNPPRKQWKERYGFEATDEWLEHVRLASVRLSESGTGGTGAFVSADGLVATNQHVGAGQIGKLSTKDRDLIKNGFYARTREEELKAPDLEVTVLVSYEDVTRRVQGAVKPGATDNEASEQRRAEIAAIEKESAAKTDLKSDVVTLYSGGEYWLYRFKKYTDVRLVFAPEEQIAFFGGDYDNFTYPRYNLDVTFFRVYENNQPAKTPHHLKWSATGPKDGEFIVVSGVPGSTNRLLTTAQLHYHRDMGNPVQMQVWTTRRDALNRYAKTSAEAARRASGSLRSLENSIKRLTSQQAGLLNARLMTKKEEEERALRREIAARPEQQKIYGPAWEQIASAYKEMPAMAKRIAFSTLAPSRLANMASQLVRYSAEITKPNDKRLDEYRDSKLESLKYSLLSSAPLYTDMEEAILAAWFEEAQKTLGANDPFVKAALQGATPAEAARKAVSNTQLTDPARRKALLEGGASEIAKSTDSMIELARRIEPVYRELRAWEEEKIKNVEASAGQKIAQARFAVYGKTMPPDATSSLRLSYGVVSGYEEDTTLVPYKTTYYGLYDRAESFNEKPPYNLPERYKTGKTKLELSTPFNFVYTADTIGGNSGSPVINRNLELVGLNFDSNIQKLPNRYVYVDEAEGGRAVGVHSAAIIEALRKLYGAEKLVEELLGR